MERYRHAYINEIDRDYITALTKNPDFSILIDENFTDLKTSYMGFKDSLFSINLYVSSKEILNIQELTAQKYFVDASLRHEIQHVIDIINFRNIGYTELHETNDLILKKEYLYALTEMRPLSLARLD